MSKLYLAFSKHKGVFSALIRWQNWGKFSHVDFYDEVTGTVIGAVALKGVREQKLSEFLDGGKRSVEMCYVEVTDTQKAAILQKARADIGKIKYDYGGIWSFLRRSMRFNAEDRFFCNEYVLNVCADNGVILLRGDRGDYAKTNPTTLWLSPCLVTE